MTNGYWWRQCPLHSPYPSVLVPPFQPLRPFIHLERDLSPLLLVKVALTWSSSTTSGTGEEEEVRSKVQNVLIFNLFWAENLRLLWYTVNNERWESMEDGGARTRTRWKSYFRRGKERNIQKVHVMTDKLAKVITGSLIIQPSPPPLPNRIVIYRW